MLRRSEQSGGRGRSDAQRKLVPFIRPREHAFRTGFDGLTKDRDGHVFGHDEQLLDHAARRRVAHVSSDAGTDDQRLRMVRRREREETLRAVHGAHDDHARITLQEVQDLLMQP